MPPLPELMNQTIYDQVSQDMLALQYRTTQDYYLDVKDKLLSHIVPTLISARHSLEKYPVMANHALMGIEIGELMLPVARLNELGQVLVLRDGNLHQLLVSEQDRDLVSIGFNAVRDKRLQRQVFDRRLINYVYSNSLIYQLSASGSIKFGTNAEKSLYTLNGDSSPDLTQIYLWRFHNLQTDSSLTTINKYRNLLVEFADKLYATFLPANTRT